MKFVEIAWHIGMRHIMYQALGFCFSDAVESKSSEKNIFMKLFYRWKASVPRNFPEIFITKNT
jgi:hypothetical protein